LGRLLLLNQHTRPLAALDALQLARSMLEVLHLQQLPPRRARTLAAPICLQ